MRRYFTFLICALVVGCGHLTFRRGEETLPPALEAAAAKDYTIDALLFGMIALTKLPLESELCPTSRIDTLTLNMDGSQVLLAIVTLGIYTPHDVRVQCIP